MKKTIAIVVCIHGTERYGLSFKIRRGLNVPVFIGNPKALKKNVRFIDKDLNRVFPGNENGCYEERRAKKLLEKLKSFDVIIDLHSSSNTISIFGIITKPNTEKINLARAMGLKKLVIMPERFSGGKALIDNVDCGISLEVGPHKRKKNFNEVFDLIINLSKNSFNKRMEIYEVFDVIEGDKNFGLLIENFRKVKKGQRILQREEFFSEFDFIPILVGEEAYCNILCLASRKLKKI